MIYWLCCTCIGFEEKFLIERRSSSQGLSYDFGSIMHYRHNAFSRDGDKSTIVPCNRTIPRTILGKSATATDLDFLHINLLYCGGMDANFMYVYTLYIGVGTCWKQGGHRK